ncbi:MAG: NmrA family NAD(P)-binding protein [bacterium]|nr:NmrA family NAD(P)-binding protein [bacterium]
MMPSSKGSDSLFLLTANSITETFEALSALHEAKKLKYKKIVYLSVHNPDWGRHVAHFGAKENIEHAIKESGIPYTILQPNNFYQNDYWFKDPILPVWRASSADRRCRHFACRYPRYRRCRRQRHDHRQPHQQDICPGRPRSGHRQVNRRGLLRLQGRDQVWRPMIWMPGMSSGNSGSRSGWRMNFALCTNSSRRAA